MKKYDLLTLVLFLGLLAACGSSPAPAVEQPAATQPPAAATQTTSAPVAEQPTAAAQATSAPATSSAGIPTSRTPEGYQVLGDSAAPLTLVMYSDFL